MSCQIQPKFYSRPSSDHPHQTSDEYGIENGQIGDLSHVDHRSFYTNISTYIYIYMHIYAHDSPPTSDAKTSTGIKFPETSQKY